MDDKKPTEQKKAKTEKRVTKPKPQVAAVEKATPISTPPEPPVISLSALQLELTSVKELVLAHTQQIAELQAKLSRKRSPAHNGKVQIKDKTTGTVYPSKNNAYQSLLKAGELKDLVDKGIFGLEPEKNNFGWFALVRALPDRFEEVKAETK